MEVNARQILQYRNENGLNQRNMLFCFIYELLNF